MNTLPLSIDLATSRVVYAGDGLVGVRNISLDKGSAYTCPITFNSGNTTGINYSISGFTYSLSQPISGTEAFITATNYSNGSFSFNVSSPVLDYIIAGNDTLSVESNIAFSGGNGIGYILSPLTTIINNNPSIAPAQEYYPLSNPSGYITGLNTGNFITSNQTGGFVTTLQTGNFVTSNQTGGFASTVSLNATGSTLQSEITTLQGVTGSFYLKSNPSGYITGLNTGNFLTSSVTGNFITTAQTGKFYPSYNPSGYLPSFSGIPTTPEILTVTIPVSPVDNAGFTVGFFIGASSFGTGPYILFSSTTLLDNSSYVPYAGGSPAAFYIGYAGSPSQSAMAAKLADLINNYEGSEVNYLSGPAVANGDTVQITDYNGVNFPYNPRDYDSNVTYVVNQTGVAGDFGTIGYDSNGNIVVSNDIYATDFYGDGANLTNVPASLPIYNSNDNIIINQDGNCNLELLNENGDEVFGIDGNNNPFITSSNGAASWGFDSNGDLVLTTNDGVITINGTLPISDPGVAGQLYTLAGALMVSAG